MTSSCPTVPDAAVLYLPNVGHETLLHACMSGDATLFQHGDSIEDAWAAVEPPIEAWKTGEPEPYAAGSAGTAAACALLSRDGQLWAVLDEGARAPADPPVRAEDAA